MPFILLLLGIVSIVYGLLVFSVGSGTGFFLVWIAIGLMLILLFFAVKTGRWQQLPGAFRIAFYSLAGLFIAGFIIFCILILPHLNDKGEKDLDYIIVLGAQVYESGPSAVLSYRLEAALDYLNENPDTVCIVSGGQGYNEPDTEAAIMKAWLVSRGISADRILEENTSRSTIQNIKNSMELAPLKDARVGIVTNNFHLNRAVAIARKQGLANVCGISAKSTNLFLPNNLLREFLGTIKDLLAGNM